MKTNLRSAILRFSSASLLLLAVVAGSTAAHVRTATAPADARLGYKMRSTNDVVMYLSGTTPVKNWQMTAHGLRGDAQFTLSNDNQLVRIDGLNFVLPVKNLKGEEAGMDRDAYKALKADQYKEITFALRSANVTRVHCDTYLVKALGDLTVAGVTRTVTLSMQSKITDDGSIAFSGAEDLKMSDYNVERPSAFFGIIKADDHMKLTYTLIFSKERI